LFVGSETRTCSTSAPLLSKPRAIGEQGRLERRGAPGIAARNWNRARIRRVHVGGDVELGSIEFERFERLGLLKVVEAP
jgi:hypothetical protein